MKNSETFKKIKEVKNMRKILIVLVAVLFSVAMIYGYADAKVSGPCVNCHTMHNSQGNTSVVPGELGPQSGLLNNNCLGCHSTTGSDPLADSKPRVKSTTEGSFTNDNSLAGGFFGATQSSSDNHSSNQHDVGVGNKNLPAGYSGSWYTGGTSGLTCAGTNGCHGNEQLGKEDDMQAIRGGHHNPTAYRMLFVNGSTVTGIGAADFEKALIASPSLDDKHNIYNAKVGGPSISELCGKCHSAFHSDTGSAGAWKRHPTDVGIPTDWEIYSDFTNKWTNNPTAWKEHPLGFSDISSQTASNARVICVSCHRAHGTQYADNLRWDYQTEMEAGNGKTYGCLGCHNKQR